MRNLIMSEKTDLELLIDAAGVQNVIEAIGEICCGKAEHVETNYQDRELAKAWRKVFLRLGPASAAAGLIP